jgi:hypothetical protein
MNKKLKFLAGSHHLESKIGDELDLIKVTEFATFLTHISL